MVLREDLSAIYVTPLWRRGTAHRDASQRGARAAARCTGTVGTGILGRQPGTRGAREGRACARAAGQQVGKENFQPGTGWLDCRPMSPDREPPAGVLTAALSPRLSRDRALPFMKRFVTESKPRVSNPSWAHLRGPAEGGGRRRTGAREAPPSRILLASSSGGGREPMAAATAAARARCRRRRTPTRRARSWPGGRDGRDSLNYLQTQSSPCLVTVLSRPYHGLITALLRSCHGLVPV